MSIEIIQPEEEISQKELATLYYPRGDRHLWTCPNCGQVNNLSGLGLKRAHSNIVALFLGDSICVACKHCDDATLLTLHGDVSLVAHNPHQEDKSCVCDLGSLDS